MLSEACRANDQHCADGARFGATEPARRPEAGAARNRLFMLDVPENVPIAAVARDLPNVTVDRIGPYFAIESEVPISIDRRSTGVRHAVWYSCVAGLAGWRIAQWDKDALRVEDR